MKNFKRFLAMTLTMLMVLGCFATSAMKFPDVSGDYTKAIDVLSDIGVIKGYEDGNFNPDKLVERWHMSLWIAKIMTAKVSDADLATIWKAEANSSQFTDVVADQYIGSVSYAANLGIIVGKAATAFAPADGITYQEALTMVVRALGYGSATMNAGYPWSYITKASALNLDNGITGVAYTDVLTRAQTAQILYNAFYTTSANGLSWAKDVFNLSTVVITATPTYKIANIESLVKTGYVGFNLLNNDGTINTTVTYYLPQTAFGIDAADSADAYVGASFTVTTINNFKSLTSAYINDSKVFDQAAIVGKGKADAASALLTLDGEDYQAVTSFSSLYNTQGIKGNYNELIIYNQNAASAQTASNWKVDANYNLLNANGTIVAYYRPDVTGSFYFPYVKADGTPVAIELLATITATATTETIVGVIKTIVTSEITSTILAKYEAALKALGAVKLETGVNGYAVITNTYDLVKNNKYAKVVAYDDNNDGVYDRAFYQAQYFGRIITDADGHYHVDSADAGLVSMLNDTTAYKFVDADGKALTAAPVNKWVKYYFDPLSNYFYVIDDTYTTATGLVTAVVGSNDGSGSIVIGGVAYKVNTATFPGTFMLINGAKATIAGMNQLVGKRVNYVLVDGAVARIYDATADVGYVAFDRWVGITTQGYGQALVYTSGSTNASTIVISQINGYTYQQYMALQTLQNTTALFNRGDLFAATKDANGFYSLTTQGMITPPAGVEGFEFQNGLALFDPWSHRADASYAFRTDANTIFVIYGTDADSDTSNTFFTAKGMPSDQAEISFTDWSWRQGMNSRYFVQYVDGIARFVYVYGADYRNFNLTNIGNNTNYTDTIIYVNKTSLPTGISNDLGSLGYLLGYTWSYGNVLDMRTGAMRSVNVYPNTQLQVGCFYNVKNGYVEDVAPITMNSAYLTYVSGTEWELSTLVYPNAKLRLDNIDDGFALVNLYKIADAADAANVALVAPVGDIVRKNDAANGNPIKDYVADLAADINGGKKLVEVYYYDDPAFYSNKVMLIKSIAAMPNYVVPATTVTGSATNEFAITAAQMDLLDNWAGNFTGTTLSQEAEIQWFRFDIEDSFNVPGTAIDDDDVDVFLKRTRSSTDAAWTNFSIVIRDEATAGDRPGTYSESYELFVGSNNNNWVNLFIKLNALVIA